MNSQHLPLTLASISHQKTIVGNLQGASLSLCLYNTANRLNGLCVALTPDMASLNRLEKELLFFRGQDDFPIFVFPDRETLPYDHFSPHPDISSERMATLYRLPHVSRGILLVAIPTLMHRLMPRDYLVAHSFVVSKGQILDPMTFRTHLEKCGYHMVSQVMEPGEYAVRGALLDVFPMGSKHPYRIDLMNDEVDSLRVFDTSTQRTLQVIDEVRLLPAHEFPLTGEGINTFRQNWRTYFSGNPLQCPIYEDVSNGRSAAGLEYYLPLFFEKTENLLGYVTNASAIFTMGDIYPAATLFWEEVNERYEQLRHDITHPILPPSKTFFPIETLFAEIKRFPNVQLHNEQITGKDYIQQADTKVPPVFLINRQAEQPFAALKQWLSETTARVLFCVESEGRHDVFSGLLKESGIFPEKVAFWRDFLTQKIKIGIVLGGLEEGLVLTDPDIVIISESQVFGQQIRQRVSRKRDADIVENIVRDLTELQVGAPVVHLDHGVGRYMGLEVITAGGETAEYLTLVYQDDAKVYVPVTSLHLISRYGGDAEHAPLHRLGSSQWDKAKRKAREKIHDVAAELLHIYAQREIKTGFSFVLPEKEYQTFAAAFPFEETPDQARAIASVLEDMTSTKCMDRLVCGDVGFGKTEVAIRAAFVAAL
ncbi:MAG: mfd, partial [Gammaproteobacteria bacterium]|nr:mfd [Gammaproteobacteria bacterium]